MKKIKFRYNGKTKAFEETTHAALFRAFFDYWKKLDLKQTIYGTFESGLRLSNEEYYEGNVIKKKNLMVSEDLYVITHITPAAMDKGLVGFLNAVGADIIEPRQIKTKPVERKPSEDPEARAVPKEDPEKVAAEEESYEDFLRELESTAEAIASGKKVDEETSMGDLVEKKMALRDKKIKARLMRGNRS